MTCWLSVKDSTNASVLQTYLERYPEGEFAAIARALAEHYDRKLKAEQAAQEEERKRIEEERMAADVKRLEEKRRLCEAAIPAEGERAEEIERSEEIRRLSSVARGRGSISASGAFKFQGRSKKLAGRCTTRESSPLAQVAAPSSPRGDLAWEHLLPGGTDHC